MERMQEKYQNTPTPTSQLIGYQQNSIKASDGEKSLIEQDDEFNLMSSELSETQSNEGESGSDSYETQGDGQNDICDQPNLHLPTSFVEQKYQPELNIQSVSEAVDEKDIEQMLMLCKKQQFSLLKAKFREKVQVLIEKLGPYKTRQLGIYLKKPKQSTLLRQRNKMKQGRPVRDCDLQRQMMGIVKFLERHGRFPSRNQMLQIVKKLLEGKSKSYGWARKFESRYMKVRDLIDESDDIERCLFFLNFI